METSYHGEVVPGDFVPPIYNTLVIMCNNMIMNFSKNKDGKKSTWYEVAVVSCSGTKSPTPMSVPFPWS